MSVTQVWIISLSQVTYYAYGMRIQFFKQYMRVTNHLNLMLLIITFCLYSYPLNAYYVPDFSVPAFIIFGQITWGPMDIVLVKMTEKNLFPKIEYFCTFVLSGNDTGSSASVISVCYWCDGVDISSNKYLHLWLDFHLFYLNLFNRDCTIWNKTISISLKSL